MEGIVCMRLEHCGGRAPRVVGPVLVIEGNALPFKNLDDLALVLCDCDVRPIPLPEEEGWEGVADLPPMLWDELAERIRDYQTRRP